MEDARYALFKRLMETWQADPDFRRDAEAGVSGLFPRSGRDHAGEKLFGAGFIFFSGSCLLWRGRSLRLRAA